MTHPNKNARPLAGGNYIRDDRGLRQVDKSTAPHPGKSAEHDQAKRKPALAPVPAPKADKPAGDK